MSAPATAAPTADTKGFLTKLAHQVARGYTLQPVVLPVVKRSFKKHTRKVYCVSWGGDSQHIVSAGQEGLVLVTNAATGLMASLPAKVPFVMQCALSTDLRLIATGGMDNAVRLLDRSGTGAPSETKELLQHDGYISSVKFADGSAKLLSGSGDGTAVLWDVATGEAIRSFRGHAADVTGISVEPAGSVFGTSSTDKHCRLWDVREPCAVRVFAAKYAANCVALTPGGKGLLVGCDNASWELFDVGCYNQVARGKVKKGRCESIACSSSGRLVFTGWDDAKMVVADTYTPTEMEEVLSAAPAGAAQAAHSGAINSMEVAPDGSALASGSFDSTVKVWTAGGPDRVLGPTRRV